MRDSTSSEGKSVSASGECIQVVVRCRPFSDKEKRENRKGIIDTNIPNREITIRCESSSTSNNSEKSFTFDAVYDEEMQQKLFYEESCFSLVENVLDGFNATIFAYGQTGCGKSWTMQGGNSLELQGVIPNSFTHIFDHIDATTGVQFLVRCSYLEIYNEEIRDLLCDPKTATKCELHEDPTKGVFVRNLTDTVVHNALDLQSVLDKGLMNRTIGATLMNDTSSRSHSIFSITVEMSTTDENGKEHIRVGKLNLVDLAGSERQKKTGATGQQLKEGTKINLSLSALGNVISALSEGRGKHVPYRDSKLTRLLQDSLGGNTKTLMVAAISPADYNYEETLSTLRYANRAKNIQNRPKVNEDPKDAQLRAYKDEIDRLKQLLAAQQIPHSLAIEMTGESLSNSSGVIAAAAVPEPLVLDDEKKTLGAETEGDAQPAEAIQHRLSDLQSKMIVHGESSDPTESGQPLDRIESPERDASAYKERKQRARRRRKARQAEILSQLTDKVEEVDVLLQTVTDGRSQLELAEEKMLRMKRRYEKRIKILENDLDDARDELYQQQQSAQELLCQEARNSRLYEELCRAALGSRELTRVLEKCRYDDETEAWTIPYVCQRSAGELTLSNSSEFGKSSILVNRGSGNQNEIGPGYSEINGYNNVSGSANISSNISSASLPLLPTAAVKKQVSAGFNVSGKYGKNDSSSVAQSHALPQLPQLGGPVHSTSLQKDRIDGDNVGGSCDQDDCDDVVPKEMKPKKNTKKHKKNKVSDEADGCGVGGLSMEWGFAEDLLPDVMPRSDAPNKPEKESFIDTKISRITISSDRDAPASSIGMNYGDSKSRLPSIF